MGEEHKFEIAIELDESLTLSEEKKAEWEEMRPLCSLGMFSTTITEFPSHDKPFYEDHVSQKCTCLSIPVIVSHWGKTAHGKCGLLQVVLWI